MAAQAIQHSASDRESGIRAGFVVFGFGLALYLFIQVGLVAGPIATRSVPPGTTDAYVYIAKAQQLITCFRQRCPALNDLRRQVANTKGETDKIAKLRSFSYQRHLYQYHLAHSVLLAGLHSLGVNWETALNAVSIVGALLIAFGVAWLLYAAFGAGPAGLALSILAFAIYPGFHGLHWIVPSNIAFGIGLLALAGIVSRSRRLDLMLPFAVLAMVWMHPAGRIYALAALALYVVLIVRTDRRRWTTVAWGLAALASPILTGLLVDRPAVNFSGLDGIPGWGFLEGVGKNLRAAFWAIYPWLFERGGIAILLLAGLGLWKAERMRAANIRWLAALAGGLCVAALLYVLPKYPAELFHRLWVLFGIVATGAASYALWSGSARLFERFVRNASEGRGRLSRYAPLVRFAAAGGIALVSLYIGVGTVVNGSREAMFKARYMTVWGEMPLDREQPRRVLARLGPGERVAYLHELSFVFYASYGGFGHGAVYGPAVTDTSLAARYYRAGGKTTMAVHVLEDFYGLIRLRSGQPIVVRSARPVDWSRAQIKVAALSRPVTLRLRLAGPRGQSAAITLPAGAGGWYALDLPKGSRSSAVALVRGDGDLLASIIGLRLSPAQARTWPWDRGIEILKWNAGASLPQAIRYRPKRLGPKSEPSAKGSGKKKKEIVSTIRFSGADLVPAGCRNLSVIEDYGATVVSRVSCPPANKKFP